MTPSSKDSDLVELLPLTELWFNVLLALADEARHGYAIIKEVEARTNGAVSPATGTMYLALQRLEEHELIAEVKTKATDGRGKRTYRITPRGRRVAALEAERLTRQVEIAVAKGILGK